MARDFLKRADPGSAMVVGTVVTDVQASLNAVTPTNIQVDGKFGGQTQDAVSAFQQARGLSVTGTVSDSTWPALMRSDAPPIFERCLQLVASFEGTGFTLIEGNFDGAGLTWGIIGFTLSNGELGSLIAAISQQLPDIFAAAFGHDSKTILDAIGPGSTSQQRMEFAKAASGPAPRFRVVEPWLSAFNQLGQQREVQRIQIARAREKYWEAIALPDSKKLGMTEELDLLLLYDVAVQNGGMSAKSRLGSVTAKLTGHETAQQRRKIVADTVTETISGKFQNDVRSRKTCIATGGGIVHGSNYTLKDWGFLDGIVPLV